MRTDDGEMFYGAFVCVTAITLVVMLAALLATSTATKRLNEIHQQEMQYLRDSLENHRDTIYVRDDWSKLIEAIIKVESNGNPNAVGKAEDVGCMQIRPIYVKEVNRILKEERYTLDDRYDPMKTLEMFHIVQNHHNPHHDIDKAIALHNKADWYKDRVIKTMNEI